MTFDQLIEYNMRNIFFEIHTQNVVEELVPETVLLKNRTWAYFWINSLKCYETKVLFIVCPSQGLPRCIKTKVLATRFYVVYCFFKKQKEACN